MKKAVVLLSGGLDSTTCLAYAVSLGYQCYALSIDYGQKHCVELEAAKAIARAFKVTQHHIINLPTMGKLGGSALTDEAIDVPDFVDDGSIPVTYVPARNTVFLSLALGFAEIVEAQALIIGVSAVDYSGYPDCRPEFIAAFQEVAKLGTKAGLEGRPIHIETPLIHLNKAQTIQLGVGVGVDYGMTISCYRANDQGEACGRCDSCVLRKKGFVDAGVADPTRYSRS
jgi:7-cyano-7-deazaguanine synthase